MADVSAPRPCHYCGAPIVWVPMRSGKAMPCDAEALTVVAFLAEDDGRGQLVRIGFRPHWATCPKADQARADAAARRAVPSSEPSGE
jgi:hypothetical protein